MVYKNRYEFLNQESRLPLLKILKKYKISKKDMDEIENILWRTYNHYDDMVTIAKFYKKKYGHTFEDLGEYLEFYDQTHKKVVDYRKLSQKSIYDDDFDEGDCDD